MQGTYTIPLPMHCKNSKEKGFFLHKCLRRICKFVRDTLQNSSSLIRVILPKVKENVYCWANIFAKAQEKKYLLDNCLIAAPRIKLSCFVQKSHIYKRAKEFFLLLANLFRNLVQSTTSRVPGHQSSDTSHYLDPFWRSSEDLAICDSAKSIWFHCILHTAVLFTAHSCIFCLLHGELK